MPQPHTQPNPRAYRCDEQPPDLDRWEAAAVLDQHAGHGPDCLPYGAGMARLSTVLL